MEEPGCIKPCFQVCLSAKCEAKVAREIFMGYQWLCEESVLAVRLICPTFSEKWYQLRSQNCELDLRLLGIWKWDHDAQLGVTVLFNGGDRQISLHETDRQCLQRETAMKHLSNWQRREKPGSLHLCCATLPGGWRSREDALSLRGWPALRWSSGFLSDTRPAPPHPFSQRGLP